MTDPCDLARRLLDEPCLHRPRVCACADADAHRPRQHDCPDCLTAALREYGDERAREALDDNEDDSDPTRKLAAAIRAGTT